MGKLAGKVVVITDADATESRALFDEWLIPVCSPAMLDKARHHLPKCDLIHPSPDRRDWRRWLRETERFPGLNLTGARCLTRLNREIWLRWVVTAYRSAIFC